MDFEIALIHNSSDNGVREPPFDLLDQRQFTYQILADTNDNQGWPHIVKHAQATLMFTDMTKGPAMFLGKRPE
jgi:hypothetical protein